jgi:hypothetical protein
MLVGEVPAPEALPDVVEKQVEHAMFIQVWGPGRELTDQSMTELVH